jgi:hypothetical protein
VTRSRLSRRLTLAASAFVFAAAARAEPPLTFRAIRALLPATVALRLLGPERGAEIVRIETRPNAGMAPGVLEVRLFSRAVAVGPNHCLQPLYRVTLTTLTPGHFELAEDEALRVGHVDETALIARAPACRLSEGQQFAEFRPGLDEAAAMRALDDLAYAQAAAGGRRLPFRLSCRDEVDRDPDLCRRGARDVLAHLPLDQACDVDSDEDDPHAVAVTLCLHESQWTLSMRDFHTNRARLSMLWKDPDPF